MFFDLDGKNEGEGFKFFESRIDDAGKVVYDKPKPDAPTFQLRSMVPKMEEVRSKQKQKFEFVLNPTTRGMERVGFFEELSASEERAEREELWDYVITGWDDKALDAKGRKIPVTKENKIRLMAIPVFDRFVARALTLLSSEGIKAKKDKEKN